MAEVRKKAAARLASRDSVDRELAAWLAELPGIDPLVEAVRMRLLRLGRQLERSLAETARAHGMTLGDWETLSILCRSGRPYQLSPGRLARSLGVTAGTMSVRIERLVRAGLVKPAASGDDARGRPVRLTAAGHRVWRRATDARTRLEAALIGETLGPNALHTLNALLRRLMVRFEARFGAPPLRGELER
ncbi:MAG TPA: MarR family transcriptional regulator [bacterium]|nr:MarR family transcriptional regulator [bacterium]